MKTFDFTDRRVLVTGASRGIGRAIARQFAASGARVAVHYNRNSAAAQETLTSLIGGPHTLIQADVAQPQQAAAMIAMLVDEMGGLDIVVNNAGIFEDHPLADVSYQEWQESWQRTLATNLIGPANICYAAGQHMIASGGGRIVNVSSRGAFRGEPLAPAYGASKAGLNSMSQSLAQHLAPHNIFVGVVAPGFVETDMASDFLDGPRGEAVRNQSPLGRVARPDEVAYAVLFLASPGSEFMTGAIIDVNGASYLRT
jgi:3-oxoacyl-[acyl-carrier protein] reductase